MCAENPENNVDKLPEVNNTFELVCKETGETKTVTLCVPHGLRLINAIINAI